MQAKMRIHKTDSGLYCAEGPFVIDPMRAVPRAVVTHAHGDHMRAGCGEYFASPHTATLLRLRLGRRAKVRTLEFGQVLRLGSVDVSLHPAGHILGSAQVRLGFSGETWVLTGDFKRQVDPSCEAFEIVPCDTFVTESTFARPEFIWDAPEKTLREILAWWDEGRSAGRASLIYTYALGKSQRILAGLKPLSDRRVLVHPDIEVFNDAYREAGIDLIGTKTLPRKLRRMNCAGELIIAPLRYVQRTFYERLGQVETAIASGWDGSEGPAKGSFDRFFRLSDHADWPDLLRTIEETGARRILTIHGRSDVLIEYLREKGYDAADLALAASRASRRSSAPKT